MGTGAETAKPGGVTGRASVRMSATMGSTAASGASTARVAPGRVSARPGMGSTTTRTTLSSRVTAGAKHEEEKKAAPGMRRPAMSSSTVGGVSRPSTTRTASALRGSSSSR